MQGSSAARIASSSAAVSPAGPAMPLHAERLQELVDQAGGAAVERRGVDDAAVRPREGEEGGHDRRHAGVEDGGSRAPASSGTIWSSRISAFGCEKRE